MLNFLVDWLAEGRWDKEYAQTAVVVADGEHGAVEVEFVLRETGKNVAAKSLD